MIHWGATSAAIRPVELAQDYPTKTVHLIEPFGVGGGPDLLARALAQKLAESWHQPVIVENVVGGGATAGPAHVAKSPADGYILLVNTSAQAYSAALLNNLPYDPLKDFIPIAALTRQPYVLVTSKASGIASIRELIAAAKAKPGTLKFASTGRGTGTHLGIEKFNLAAGIRAIHVPAGPGEAITDVISNTVAGRTAYMMAPLSLALSNIQNGKLLALGVTTTHRSSLLPDVPTLSEAGVTGFDFPIWYGVWAPAGTPMRVVHQVAKDIALAMAASDMRDWVTSHGGEPMTMTQPQFARFVLSESKNAAQVMKAAGVRRE
jgi:tripartite-type tricarboxylate transporter receptor subunit TctC